MVWLTLRLFVGIFITWFIWGRSWSQCFCSWSLQAYHYEAHYRMNWGPADTFCMKPLRQLVTVISDPGFTAVPEGAVAHSLVYGNLCVQVEFYSCSWTHIWCSRAVLADHCCFGVLTGSSIHLVGTNNYSMDGFKILWSVYHNGTVISIP